MALIDTEDGALTTATGPGALSVTNAGLANIINSANADARNQALYSGLIGLGSGLLNYDARKGYGAAFGQGLENFNKSYDTELVANKPKVTPLAGGAFVLVQYPDGRQQMMRNDEIMKYETEKSKNALEAFKAKEDYKGGVQTRVAAEKDANKTGLDQAADSAAAQGQANQLRAIATELGGTSGDNVPATGKVAGAVSAVLPNAVGSMVMPQSTKLRQDAERIIQNSLRATLGAQFTEKEGTRFLERAYNPALPVADNVARLNAMADELEIVSKNKTAATEYMKKNGTLEGFKPEVTPAAPAAGGAARINSEAEWAALPPGTQYIGPDGKTRTKR